MIIKWSLLAASIVPVITGLLLDAPDTRRFRMGFTPWPYAATIEAVEGTFEQIQQNGDIVAFHLMEGIPWQEAYEATAYPSLVEDELPNNVTLAGEQKIYLAVDSLNGNRDARTPYWGDASGGTLSKTWENLKFSDPKVIASFTNFSLDMISRYQPDYFNYASEVSDLMLNDPSGFTEFVEFSEAVYNNIKAVHPELPLMVSIALKSPDSAASPIIKDNFARIASYVDVVGISVYPFAFFEHENKGDPTTLPTNWLSQIKALAPDKPTAITEIAWPAENVNIPTQNLDVESDPQRQNAFVKRLFLEANTLSTDFIIWFTLIDYDELWRETLGEDDVSQIWRDTGLVDESLQARPAFFTWTRFLQRPLE